MSRILFAWELGDRSGHVAALLPLAREMTARGHEFFFALRDLATVSALARHQSGTFVQAPVWMRGTAGLPPAASYAESLLRFGYLDPGGLAGLYRGWRALYDAFAPDLLIVDHSPTALLAARGTLLKRAAYSTGFGIPPRTQPLPAYRWWETAPQQRLEDVERRVIASINPMLTEFGAEPLGSLAEILSTDAEVIYQFPELDAYPRAENTVHVGSISDPGWGLTPRWPAAGEHRVFAYLYPDDPSFEVLLGALAAAKVAALVYAPGAPRALTRRHESERIAISTEPFEIGQVVREVDIAVCHGGAGITGAMLGAGVPMLIVPTQMEQLMIGRRVQALGAGIVLSGELGVPAARKLIERLLREPAFRTAARAFATRHVAHDQATVVRGIADRFEALIAEKRA